jgi:hypothetical protein
VAEGSRRRSLPRAIAHAVAGIGAIARLRLDARAILIADWKSGARRDAKEAARISKTLVPDDFEYEWMEAPSAADVRRARSCLTGEPLAVITLYVKTDARDVVTRVVSVDPSVGRLVNVVSLGRRLF